MQGYGRVSQAGCGNSGDADVNRHCLHVEAVKGDAVSVCAEVFIAPGGAIAADYIDLEIRIAEGGSQIVEQIEDARIIGVNIAGAVIAQIVIEPVQRFLIVSIAIAIDDVEAFAGVGMEKVQLVGTAHSGWWFCLGRSGTLKSAG